MSIVSFCIQKGGVGKTTAASNFASFLALKGHKTLIIDFDSQANATMVLYGNEPELTIQHALIDNTPVDKIIVSSNVPNLDILPCDIGFAKVEWKIMTAMDNTYQLRDVITRNNLDKTYEYIIIDSPPSLGILTLNVLCATEYVMIPLGCDGFSIKGLRDFMDTLQVIKGSEDSERRPNKDIKILGAFLNLYDPRKNLHQGIEADMANFFGELLFKTRVRQSIKISEANTMKSTIFLYAKNSPVADDFGNLFTEAYERLNSLFNTEVLNKNIFSNPQEATK